LNLITVMWNNYIVNILDIAIVSFIFYYLLMLVKDTRAVQVLRGLLILFLATLVVPTFHFQTLGWLLEKFWVVGIIVIVMIFQPELRTILADLGRTYLDRSAFKEKLVSIDEIIRAVQLMKKKRRGALIILERQTGLKNYIESGVQVNGNVSAEILIAIFQPNSPIHDGAVIIKGNILAAAGCILPLTSELDTDKIMGTRHRAAIGITEVSDAYAIVVSEKTGRVSFARNKEYDSNIDIEKLRKKITELYKAK